MKQLDYDIVDCVQIGSLCSSVDTVDAVLEYLEFRFKTFVEMDRHQVFVLDSVYGVCLNVEESTAQNMLEVVKSNRVATWLLEKVYKN